MSRYTLTSIACLVSFFLRQSQSRQLLHRINCRLLVHTSMFLRSLAFPSVSHCSYDPHITVKARPNSLLFRDNACTTYYPKQHHSLLRSATSLSICPGETHKLLVKAIRVLTLADKLRNICFVQGLYSDRIQTIVRRIYSSFDDIAETGLEE